ncbi:hypothetical protein VPH5P1C_0229 [Vibrio phage 5P1c]|nr:putative membrane lipoprotein [Vibrio phage 495E54-1]
MYINHINDWEAKTLVKLEMQNIDTTIGIEVLKIKNILLTTSITLTALVSGCTKYENQHKYFREKDLAATDFFIENKSKIEALSSQQEMLGWVLYCEGRGYSYTNYRIGDLSNPVRPNEVDTQGCEVRDFLHTHPRSLGSVDYFSEGDMKVAKWRGIYLFTTEKYYVRFHNGTQDRYGEVVANIRFK